MLSWPTPHIGLLLLSPLQHHTAHIIQPSQFSFLLNRSPILFKAVIWSVKPIYPVLRWSWEHHSHSSNERDSVGISTWSFWEKHATLAYLIPLAWLKRYSRWNTPHEAVRYTCENQNLTLQETDLKPGASGSDDTRVPICERRVSHAFLA